MTELRYIDFKDKIIQAYHSQFPNSWCHVKLVKCLGKSIMIDCYLELRDDSKCLDDCGIDYWNNDMFQIRFWIYDIPHNISYADPIREDMTLTPNRSQIRLASRNSDNEYDYLEIPFTETKDTAENLINVFKEYVDKLYDIVNAQIKENNIYPNFKHLIYSKMRHGKTPLTPY